MERILPQWRKENKYSRWYDALMEKARNRDLERPYEKHHVRPISLGGAKKSETVKLTRREHFLAHWLLVKFATGWNYHKIAYALMMLIKLAGSCSSWKYEVAKRATCELAREQLKQQRLDPAFVHKQRKASSKSAIDQWEDEEFREKVLAALLKGNKERWEDPEFREKQSKVLGQIATDAWADPEIRERTIASMRETANDPVHLAANSERAKKQWEDPEFRALMSGPEFLKKRGEATAEANRRRIWTPEMTAKRVAKVIETWDAKRGGPKPSKPGHAKGERNAFAKLTESDIRTIRDLTETEPRQITAQKFGIHRRTVQGIQERTSWKHVE